MDGETTILHLLAKSGLLADMHRFSYYTAPYYQAYPATPLVPNPLHSAGLGDLITREVQAALDQLVRYHLGNHRRGPSFLHTHCSCCSVSTPLLQLIVSGTAGIGKSFQINRLRHKLDRGGPLNVSKIKTKQVNRDCERK